MSSSSEDSSSEKRPNRWYLAYGSNLCSKVFQGRRGIQPLAQTNVLVPDLELTFDLPGIPYWEPCFANVRMRTEDAGAGPGLGEDVLLDSEARGKELEPPERKVPQLIGVAYLVTSEDFAHIVATEGGGSSYKVVSVKCWPLARKPTDMNGDSANNVETNGESSELVKEANPIYVSTLLAPDSQRWTEPIEPSKRYINLLRAGARENDLPPSYIAYLDSIPYYRITGLWKRVGAAVYIAMWLPPLLSTLVLSTIFSDSNTGHMPKWLGYIQSGLRSAMLQSYLKLWKGIFGNGERTAGENVVPIAIGSGPAKQQPEKAELEKAQDDVLVPHLDFMGR